MHIYLVARYDRKAELRGYAEDLRALGHTISASWLEEGDAEAAYNWNPDPAMYRRFARQAIDDLMASDCSIHFTEPPTRELVSGVTARGGRHVELGLAYGLRDYTAVDGDAHRIVIVGPRENVFHYLPAVDHFPTWDEALTALAPTGVAF